MIRTWTKVHTLKGADKLLNLKALRLGRSLTQDQLADKLDITTRAYQYIEYGEKKPSYEVIVRLQALFNKDINVLLSETNDD